MAFGTQPDDAGNVPLSSVYSKENNTFPALAAEPGAYKDANTNQSSAAVMSFLRPLIVQKAHNVTGSGAKTVTCAFTGNNIAGNSIIVAMGMGEVDNGSTITLAITDTLTNTYTSAVKASQSTTLEAAIFYAVNVAAGANTITITIAGGSSANTAIGVEIYEVWGIVTPVDQTATGNNAGSTSPATGAVTPIVPNELAFAAISAGGNTITAGAGWTLDSTSLSPTGGNLVSFGVESQALTAFASLTPSATLSGSTSWAMAAATFKSVIVPIEGTIRVSNAVALGQQIMANSSPVVVASDQIVPTLAALQQYSTQGQTFVVSTANFVTDTGGGGHYGFLSIFNPLASGHNLLITRFSVSDTISAQLDVYNSTSTDPALANAATITNMLIGGGQAAVFTATYAVLTGSYPGTTVDVPTHQAVLATEILQNNQVILLPPGKGVAYGLNLTTVTTHNWQIIAAVTQL